MTHGPCGAHNPTAPRMRNGQCSKKFPKALESVTVDYNDGYPRYRRHCTEDTTIHRGNADVAINNHWVVPYNPWLCVKYDAHINVEVCNSVVAVKYLYKYVYKCHDRAMMSTSPNPLGTQSGIPQATDEISRYVDVRYISASESCWHLLSLPIHGQSPAVVTLTVHLPSMHFVTYNPSTDLPTVLEQNRTTMLTAWFELNRPDPEARQYTYPEIPRHYTWNTQDRAWKKRRNRSSAISRLVFVSPRDFERCCLRLLLLHVPGATSFEDMRTINGHLHGTFQAAAHARGLLASDDEWQLCMDDAVSNTTPHQLRNLFSVLLLFCNLSRPGELWTMLQRDLCQDFLHGTRRDGDNEPELTESIVFHALGIINEQLLAAGTSLASFPRMPQLPVDYILMDSLPDLQVNAANLETLAEQARENVPRLNSNQRAAFDAVAAAVEGHGNHNMFFIDSPSGTGKSFVYNTVIAHVRAILGKTVLAVASSGIAALQLTGGRTAHSVLKVPISIEDSSVCMVPMQSRLANTLRNTDVIIWDEAPMTHRYAFEAVDRTLRDITGANLPFGGKVMLMGGDFRQVLPVVPRGSQAQTEDVCLKNSHQIWPHVHTLHLWENMRVGLNQVNAYSATFLLWVGNGVEPVVDKGEFRDYIRLPNGMMITQELNTSLMQTLINCIYGGLGTSWSEPNYFTAQAILTTKNVVVDELDDIVTSQLLGEEVVYLSIDTPVGDEALALFPVEFLNSANPSGMPPHWLVLKAGQPIILLCNLDPQHGLYNGTPLICHQLSCKYIQADIIVGQFRGNTVLIPRIQLCSGEGPTNPIQFNCWQFPVKPALAMTINISQGQTLNTVGLYLPEPVFSHGQLYVALSRVTSMAGISIVVVNGSILNYEDIYTDNVVYKSILQPPSEWHKLC